MKVQRIGEGGGSKTYVNVPRWARDGLGLDGGDVFLSAAGPRSLAVLRRREFADDYAVRLTEYVTERYGGEAYTAVRMTIPLGIVRRMGIRKGDAARFSGDAARPLITFAGSNH